MIHCTIDGRTGYPDMKSKIKVTFENQYIKDSGEYTYQISFPMSVLANRMIFGNINRIDVTKNVKTFESCELRADNRLLISGKGTVVGVTQDAVKLQIVGGKSKIKYNSKFEKHFIDEIEYPSVNVQLGTKYLNAGGARYVKVQNLMEISLTSSEVVGVKGEYAFNPVYDETNDCIANNIFYNDGKTYMYNVSVQPYLFHVLRCVLQYEGFTLRRNDFDVDPWNRLVICSARRGIEIKKTLPHWTVYNFLEEIRKLFNGSFFFDERTKSVDFLSSTEIVSNTKTVRECLDEFNTEYDDDGLQNLAISNVEYVLAESAYRDPWEIIPQEVLDKFPMITAERWQDLPTQTAKEERTSIYNILNYGNEIVVGKEDPDSGQTYYASALAMAFNPLVRDEESDDFEQLHISPVAMTSQLRWGSDEIEKAMKRFDRKQFEMYLPSIVNDKEENMEEMTYDEDEEEYYITVQDAILNTDLIKDQEEDKDEIMQIMFQGLRTYNYDSGWPEDPSTSGAWYRRYPITFTDARNVYDHFVGYGVNINSIKHTDSASLALIKFPPIDCIGKFASHINVEKHNMVCLKFVAHDIPSPTSVYVFRNKKFLCQKIEIEVGEDGVDKVKTGYFYELES